MKDAKKSEPVAVIEIGSTSVRMVVAEIGRGGKVRVLDSLQQAVSLGKDTFTKGQIGRGTSEDCVKALRSFQRVIDEYGIRESSRIRAVTTSAVREAANRQQFLDRLFIATGTQIEVLDQAEVNRLTYLAVRPLLSHQPFFRDSDTVVVEVGGGSTEAMVFHRRRVHRPHMYRMGSLRLREMLEEYRASPSRLRHLMRTQVDQFVAEILSNIGSITRPHMLALGGEARFACSHLLDDAKPGSLNGIAIDTFEALVDDILHLSVDEVVRRYRLSYQEAETVGPALLVYARLARALKVRRVLVGDASLRDGLLAEMAAGGSWTADFKRQIINSALEVGKRYKIDLRHARNVARASQLLFAALAAEHHLDDRDEVVLTLAALLHECGQFVSATAHHKHSMYLILNSEVFGLGPRDLLITALVARYHRRALPKPTHPEYASLPRHDRIRVLKLAAILRLANALDRTHSPRMLGPEVSLENNRVVITVARSGDVELERLRVQQRSELFRQVYATDVVFRTGSGKKRT